MGANLFDARSKMERLLAGQADRVVASCVDELVDLMRLGVDVDAFSIEGPIADRGAGPHLVAVGKLFPHNGFSTLIEVLPGIPGAEYVVAGSIDGAAGGS